MLKQITINNFAIINKTHIEFNDGFTVITGQTGAGKSIVVDAIMQLLGARSNTKLIGKHNDFSFIEGVFDLNDNVKKILVENDYDLDNDYLIISKKISNDGKSQLKINSRIATIDLVKNITSNLVEIHSQNSSSQLLNSSSHLSFVDSLFKEDELNIKELYQKEYLIYKDLIKQQNNLNKMNVDVDLLDFYQSQLNEIDNNIINEEEYEELLKKEKYYQEFESLSEILNQTVSLFEQAHISDVLNQISNNTQKLCQYSDNFTKINDDLNDYYYGINENEKLLKEELLGLDFDSYEYNNIKEKIYAHQKVMKKYSFSYELVLEKQNELLHNIDLINNSDKIKIDLDNKVNEQEKVINKLAIKLNEYRLNYANFIENSILEHLSFLHMSDAKFKVDISKVDYNEDGFDKIVFMFNANKGEQLFELNKVASGGELSRLMLAFNLISNKDDKTLIFDEIDTGVSGAVAEAIGLKIKEISKYNNVISITHLFQVAIHADYHLYIEKNNLEDITTSQCNYLNEEEKINQIAMMLSGDLISDTALKHASELLKGVNNEN